MEHPFWIAVMKQIRLKYYAYTTKIVAELLKCMWMSNHTIQQHIHEKFNQESKLLIEKEQNHIEKYAQQAKEIKEYIHIFLCKNQIDDKVILWTIDQYDSNSWKNYTLQLVLFTDHSIAFHILHNDTIITSTWTIKTKIMDTVESTYQYPWLLKMQNRKLTPQIYNIFRSLVFNLWNKESIIKKIEAIAVKIYEVQ